MDKEQAVGEDYHHHMQIPWQDFVEDDNVTPAKEAPLVERFSGGLGLFSLRLLARRGPGRDVVFLCGSGVRELCAA